METPPTPPTPKLYLDPDSAAVLQGAIVPGGNIAQAAVAQLQADLKADAALAEQWKNNPREILADRGFFRDLQDEILTHSGIAVPEEGCKITGISNCCLFTIVLEA